MANRTTTSIVMSKQEHQDIRIAAALVDMSISDYIKSILFSKTQQTKRQKIIKKAFASDRDSTGNEDNHLDM